MSICVTASGESRVADETVSAAFDVTTAEVQALTIERPADDRVVARVNVGEQVWTLDLRKHDIRSANFQLLVRSDASGPLVPVDTPPIHTYRGYVREMPTAVVAGFFYNDKLTAVIFTETDQIAIQPLSTAGLAGDDYIVYRASDQALPGKFTCGNTDVRGNFGGFQATPKREQYTEGSPSASGTGLTVADIAIQADFEFYEINGSSVAATLADIERVMNTVALRYEVATFALTYEITTVVVQTTSNQPFSSTNNNTLLGQFGDAWNSLPESSIQRDVAHLFTGKEIDGNVIGTASLAVICSTSAAYGFSQSRFTFNLTSRSAVTAHELGHNWSATHCDVPAPCETDCRIMASAIGGCGTPSTFGTRATAEIGNHANTRSCLADLASSRSMPFFDTFPAFTLDPAKWSYNFGTLVSEGGFNAPSPRQSATLGSNGTGPYDAHELRSNFILLAGESLVPLTYHTEHRGVASGGELIIEYWSEDDTWLEINRIVSDGTSQFFFDFHQHTLPADAHHDEFRLRIRTEIDAGFWYIDDIFIGSDTAPILTADPGTTSACDGGVAEIAVGAIGTPPLSFQWRRDGVDVSGGTEARLVIDPVDPSDAGLYSCVVTNAFGNVESAAATLSVILNTDCDDGVLCNGIETCVDGACQDGGDPCTLPELSFCDDGANACVACLFDSHCNDNNLCNGEETCVSGECVTGADEAAGTPCGDDADTLCTAPDSCDGLGQCQDNHEPEGIPCDDELFCNGAEICGAGQCLVGGPRCPGQQCVEGTQTCVDPAEITCSASPTLSQSGSVEVELFLTNAQELRGYQTAIEVNQISGTGSLDVNCSDGIFVNPFRPDFVFALRNTVSAVNCELLRVTAALNSAGTVSLGQEPKYMGTYILDASQDAAIGSSFEISINADDTTLSNEDQQPIAFTVGPSCIITIADCTEVNFGDVAGTQGSCQANGIVDLIDILTVLDAFAGVFGDGCGLATIDLVGNGGVCGGDGNIGLPDILAVLDAFSGTSDCPNPCVSP